MITKLVLKNFKRIGEQTYDFTPFDLLVGRNNSGKSTILQAMAVWQFCVDEFRRARRGGKSGKQVVLPNFTALPLPEFILLWKDRTDRRYIPQENGKKQEYILIEIELTWQNGHGRTDSFGVRLRYGSPQTVYAIPADGWDRFIELDHDQQLPFIAYVPPFSGLEPEEEWRDEGPLRKQIGKAQPGTVLRNLLLRVYPPADERKDEHRKNWRELTQQLKRWFSVDLIEPQYLRGRDTRITCEYRDGEEKFDIISAGSGFHQVLTLLAFFFGYQPNTILLDEPDAHLHVNLQRELLDYFKRTSIDRGVQFLVATHAEEFAKGVDARQLLWLPTNTRVNATPPIIAALAEVSNPEITQLLGSPYMVYVEGDTDERLLRSWANACEAEQELSKVCFRVMGGGTKAQMKQSADRHFSGVKSLIADAKRLMVFDYDEEETAFHPDDENETLFEWKRKNIENYLLVADAWKRAAFVAAGVEADSLFAQPLIKTIADFFAGENLTLPPGQQWRTVTANVFSAVNGKKLLFEGESALFQRLRQLDPPVEVRRESVAAAMQPNEIHADVHGFFKKVQALVGGSQ